MEYIRVILMQIFIRLSCVTADKTGGVTILSNSSGTNHNGCGGQVIRHTLFS
jgi:hypothetical protein